MRVLLAEVSGAASLLHWSGPGSPQGVVRAQCLQNSAGQPSVLAGTEQGWCSVGVVLQVQVGMGSTCARACCPPCLRLRAVPFLGRRAMPFCATAPAACQQPVPVHVFVGDSRGSRSAGGCPGVHGAVLNTHVSHRAPGCSCACSCERAPGVSCVARAWRLSGGTPWVLGHLGPQLGARVPDTAAWRPRLGTAGHAANQRPQPSSAGCVQLGSNVAEPSSTPPSHALALLGEWQVWHAEGGV